MAPRSRYFYIRTSLVDSNVVCAGNAAFVSKVEGVPIPGVESALNRKQQEISDSSSVCPPAEAFQLSCCSGYQFRFAAEDNAEYRRVLDLAPHVTTAQEAVIPREIVDSFQQWAAVNRQLTRRHEEQVPEQSLEVLCYVKVVAPSGL